ncbi:MAG: Type 1 glutamine amidotransferase-like domain-containing protein [Thermoleophilia bacterium]|nr:Type 1 glutamine amidotransferase-like domain-containing protein [Thermoleophilia bacterium]
MPRIFALGGGGFSMEPDNPVLDELIIAAAAANRPGAAGRRPRVCFLPTASGDAESYVERFEAAFVARDCETSVLNLFSRTVSDLAAFIAGQDLVYVGGGNTPNMVAIWRTHGLDVVLRDAWQNGVVLAGVSAGANCWFEASTTDGWGNGIGAYNDGLGLLSGSFTPHYDGEAKRRSKLHQLVADGFAEGLALGDGSAAVFEGTELVECVGSHADAVAFRVTRANRASNDGAVIETALPVRILLRGGGA